MVYGRSVGSDDEISVGSSDNTAIEVGDVFAGDGSIEGTIVGSNDGSEVGSMVGSADNLYTG